MNLGQEMPQRKRAASPNKQIIMRDAAKICKSWRKKITLLPPSTRRQAAYKKPCDCCRHSRQSHLDLALPRTSAGGKVRQMMPRAYALKESRMKFTRRYGMLLIAIVLVAAGAVVFSPGVAGQDEPWQIMRADYGHKELRVDVMDRLNELLARVGPNGSVEVNNQNMGGDPAPGKAKSLRIFAKNRKNETREFEINEEHFVEARFFLIPRDDWGDRDRGRDRDRDRDRDEGSGLRIIRAYYGVQGRTINVSEVLRERVREGRLRFMVSNNEMGGDPAPGVEKVLIV